MNIEWEYALWADENSKDYHYEGSIYIHQEKLYYICQSGHTLQLHIIDTDSGIGKVEYIPEENRKISCRYFFVGYSDRLLIYTGSLFVYDGEVISKWIDLKKYKDIDVHLVYDNKLFFVCHNDHSAMLFCYNMDTLSLEWQLDISGEKHYMLKEMSVFENKLVCYGRDHLLFLNIENGNIEDEINISRIDKLFQPIRVDAEHILLGYTNWSNAGVLKYNTALKQVEWRNKRRFEGPQLKCMLYSYEDTVMWVKNDTELVCVNLNDGTERYHLRTAPWLYTRLHFVNGKVIFGTAGSDGYLYCINAENGILDWSVFLKNGCAYLDFYHDSVIVGDFEKKIKQISIDTGNVIKEIDVGGEVVGNIKVYKDAVYTVAWGNSEKPIRLVKVGLERG